MAGPILATALILGTLGFLSAVPSGQNSPICKYLKPSLSAQPQTFPAPFTIETDKSRYTAGETLHVTIKATGQRKLKGFIIEARRADWTLNQDEIIGYFAETAGTDIICESQLGNGLTDDQHALGRSQGKDEIKLTWTAPTPSEGNVEFVVTLVGGPKEYWQAEKSEIVYDPAASPMPKNPSPKPDEPGPMSASTIDVAECGKSKGCYRDPPDCTGDTCTVLVTWKDVENDVVSFELTADTDGWVAVGFSNDNIMGEESMVECVWDREKSTVGVFQSFLEQEGSPITPIDPWYIYCYNKGQLFSYHVYVVWELKELSLGPTMGLSKMDGFYSKGRITCRFDRFKVMSGKLEIYDLNTPYHLVLVRGQVGDDNQKKLYIPEPFKDPWISPEKVSMSENVDITGRARYPLVKAHGCIMIIAWMMLATTGILLSRYYRPMWPNDRICGDHVWFSMHRMLMLVCCACTILAFILIFIHRGGYAWYPELPAKAHPPIGITITILIILISFMVICRCMNPKGKKDRPCCNWIHWFLTTAALCLSTPQMFIGLSLPKVHAPWWVTWVLVAFMLFHIIIELLLEIHGCINSRKQKQRTMEYELMRKNEPHREQGYEPEPVGTRFKTILLTLYLLVMIILGLIVVITVAVS